MNSGDSLCLSLANLSTQASFNPTMGVRVPVSSNPLYIDRVLKVMESQIDARYRGEVFIFALVALSERTHTRSVHLRPHASFP